MEVSDDEDTDNVEVDGDIPTEVAMPEADIEEDELEDDDEVQIVEPPCSADMEIEKDSNLTDDSLLDPVESPILDNLRALLDNNRSGNGDKQNYLRFGMESLEDWQNHICAQSDQQTFTIHAPSFEEASKMLIDMVRVWRMEVDNRKNKPAHLMMEAGPHQYQPIPPIECGINSWQALLTPLRPFFL